ncbi:amidohydrolase [Gandjariella thermophila]|uniref:Hippurate hydrolase n=1 Tax=Gandjariella thermophila TaxID=1931992 RepID=A0A4D4JEC7_9PSEU|nr:amidohydrolase [Gandjariella thermophila]GDY33008.1 hippurate hydrolase [Gandjariella thermophila]
MTGLADGVLGGLDGMLGDLEECYVDLHRHPELSYQEIRTAARVAERLAGLDYRVTTGVGGTGVVGVLDNGPGPTVLLRADMDALPVAELTGLPYASTATAIDGDGRRVPVMHACGHDMHVTWLLGAARLLAAARADWRGSVAVVFQPAEEFGGGAQAMVDDGLFELVGVPDVVLGQHVAPAPAGMVLCRAGTIMAASDSVLVRLFGRGGHGSRPETTVDPVVMAAATVLRLQTVVSREIAATDAAVVTVGAINAGTQDNVIPSEAELRVNVRSFDQQVRRRALAAVERIVRAEATASGAPREPEITVTNSFPITVNDEPATLRLTAAFTDHFGADRVVEAPLATGSEDFGVLGDACGAPSVFWFVGGIDAAAFAEAEATGRLETDVPSNHSPHFAPVPHPTIATGVRALVAAALAWLRDGPGDRARA